MKTLLNRLWKEERGQDLTEYALLLVLLALIAVGSLPTLAATINGVFTRANTALQGGQAGGGGGGGGAQR